MQKSYSSESLAGWSVRSLMMRLSLGRLKSLARRSHHAGASGREVISQWAEKLLGDPRQRFRIGLEGLEPRVLLSFGPSGLEQEALEYINRFRSDPQAELVLLTESDDADVNFAIQFFDVDLAVLADQFSQLQAVQPLAWNQMLYESAHAHNDLMMQYDQQSHRLPGEPGLADRIRAQGYALTGPSGLGESLYAYTESPFHQHAAFVIDWGDTDTGIQQPPGHRDAMLTAAFREVGIALVPEQADGLDDPSTSIGPYVTTHHYGFWTDTTDDVTRDDPYVTGVVYEDRNGDGFYTAGEGVGGIDVTVTGPEGTFTTTTMSAGGYQLRVPDSASEQQYEVTFASGGLGQARSFDVMVSSENVKVDAILEGTSVFGDLILDENGNGIDDGEPGVAAVPIELVQDGQVVRTVNTDQAGRYFFFDIPPGDYTVNVAGDLAGSNNQPIANAFTVGLDQSLERDFLVVSPGVVSARVFLDASLDGAENNSEFGMPGVVVELRDVSNSLIGSAVTDGNGNVSFTRVAPGDYDVTILPGNDQVATTAVSQGVTVVAEGLSTTQFGVVELAELSGSVFDDLNGNGVIDAGEGILAGIEVTLDQQVAAVTDAQGNYLIQGIVPGEHQISIVTSSALVASTAVDVPVPFASGASASLSFGAFVPGIIRGLLFDDLDADNTLDSGEAGLAGVTVYLDLNTNNALDQDEPATTTDIDGNYLFQGLTAGDYRIRVEQGDLRISPGGAASVNVTLQSGSDRVVNFAVYEPATIFGHAFDDPDGDGLDQGDSVVGLTIQLRTLGGSVLQSVTTDANGDFTFTGLLPGDYVVAPALPGERLPTTDPSASFTLTSGSTVAVNFGSEVSSVADLRGSVYEDSNANGVLDLGEGGLPGVRVYLDLDADNILDPDEPTRVTNASGDYAFNDIDPDLYVVRLALDDGFVQTQPANDDPRVIELRGGIRDDIDFGVSAPDLPDLVPAISSSNLQSVSVPGDRAFVLVRVDNVGSATASGAIEVNLYAVPEGELLDTQNDVQVGQLSTFAFLPAGGATFIPMSVLLTEDLAVGAYRLVAVVEPADTISEIDPTNNAVAADDPFELAWNFGSFGNRQNVALRLGDAMFTLFGGGFANASYDQADDAWDLTLQNTTNFSSMNVTTGLNQGITLGSVAGGPLSALNARTANLDGTLEIPGLSRLSLQNATGQINIGPGSSPFAGTSIQLDRAFDLQIDSELPIRSLVATQWLDNDATPDQVAAPSLGFMAIQGNAAIDVAGDFEADVTLDGSDSSFNTFNFVNITGVARDSSWDMAGRGGTILAGAWQGGAITADTLNGLIISGNRARGIDGEFNAHLTLTGGTAFPAIGFMNVTGSVSDAAWEITGAVGSANLGDVSHLTWSQQGRVGFLRLGNTTNLSLDIDGDVGGVFAGDLDSFAWTQAGRVGSVFAGDVTNASWAITGDAGAIILGDIANLSWTHDGRVGFARVGNVSDSNWSTQGMAGAFIARDIDNLSWTHAGMLSFANLGVITAADLSFADHLNFLLAARWLDGSLTLPSFGVVNITGDFRNNQPGDFGADLTLTNANASPFQNTLMISGTLDGAEIDAPAGIGMLMAGRIVNSSVRVGTSVDQQSGNVRINNANASLNNLVVRGGSNPAEPSLIGSLIAAAKLGSARLQLVDTSVETRIVADSVNNYSRRTLDGSINLFDLTQPDANADIDGQYRLEVL